MTTPLHAGSARWAPFSQRLGLLAGLLGLSLGAQAQLTVTSTDPARNTNTAPRGTDVRLTYNQTLNAGTANQVRVFSQQAGGRKAATYAISGNTLTVNPTTDFKPGETVFVTAPATVRSGTGTAAVPRVFQFTTQAGAGPGTFSGGSEVGVGQVPQDVVAADVDGDGDLDLLTANNSNPGTVSVRLNNGAGLFTSSQEVSVGRNSQRLAVGDLDGDGDLDLLTANGSDGTVSVRLNNSGTFSGNQQVSVDRFPIGVAVGDLDGDGDLDLLTANSVPSTVSVRFNDGSGGFGVGPDVPVGISPTGITPADVDGDGDLDLLTTNYNDGTVSVLLNNGGIFSTGQNVSLSNGLSAITVADVDGDGDGDLLTTNSSSGMVSVRLNQVPAPTLTSLSPSSGPVGTQVTLIGTNLTGATAVRFNGVAATSFTVVNATTVTATVPADATTGTVSVTTPTGTATSPQDFTVVIPLVVTSTNPTRNTNVAPRPTNVALTYSQPVTAANAPAVRVFSQQAGGLKAGTATSSGSTVTVNPAVDFKPGEQVSVTSVGSATATPYVYQFTTQAGVGPGTFGGGAEVGVEGSPHDVAVADVDGDGDLDLLAANTGANSVSVRLNNGQGVFGSGSEVSVGRGPRGVITADIDGDGDLDLLTANNSSSGTVSVRLNQVPCQAPTNVALGTLTLTTAQVTFTGNGSANGGYTATATPTGGGAAISATGAGSPLTLTGLAPNTAYTVTVASNCAVSLTATSDPAVAFITPCEKPVLTVPAAQTLAADADQCSATRTFAATATGTPAPTIRYAVGNTPISFPYSFPVGQTTVTVTATNSCQDTDVKTFTVQVQDQQRPVARTQNLSVALVNGQATITTDQVNNGSSDNCTIKSLSLDKTSFTCANLGPNTVQLTAVDASGNQSTAPATITVTGTVPQPVISASQTTLYLGFGSQTATLTASGAEAGATYRWSPATGLSTTTSATTTFTASTPGTFTYTVTVTNPNGCPATASVTLTVIDATCGNKSDKVVLCFKGKELCVSPNAVDALVRQGAQLGACSTSRTAAVLATGASLAAPALLEAYPNLFTARTTVRFRLDQAGPVRVVVYNAVGQQVAVLYEGQAQAGQVVERPLEGAGLPAGLYTCHLIGAGTRLSQRLVLRY